MTGRDEAAWARARDDATVDLMEKTTWRGPRDFLRDCGGCGMPFWVHPLRGACTPRLYCCEACNQRSYYRRNEPARLRKIARSAARWRLNKRGAA